MGMLQEYVGALPQHEIEAAVGGYLDRFAEQPERHDGTAAFAGPPLLRSERPRIGAEANERESRTEDVVAQGEGARAIEARLKAPASRR
jgi:hypothetical protein